MSFLLIFHLVVFFPFLYANNYNLTLAEEYDALEPGFRPMTPEEFKARTASSPIVANGNKGPLPQFPDFGISVQNSDPNRERREREQKERDDAINKRHEDLKRMQDDLKKRQEDIKRQQEDFQRKQLEEWKKKENEKKRREEEILEQERKKEREKPRRQVKPAEPANGNNPAPIIPRVNQNGSVQSPPRIENKKNDPKNGKKDITKKDDKKRPLPNRGRRQLPKRIEQPKNAGIGGNLGGKIPDPGIAIDPEDRFTGSSAGFNLSPNLIQIALIILLLMF
jgi:hypothetical protein